MNINNYIKSYDMKNNKNDLLKDNKNKAGVYCLINKVNDKIYIGSSLRHPSLMGALRVRFWVYYSENRITNANMIIYKALLKYGYENFRVLIRIRH